MHEQLLGTKANCLDYKHDVRSVDGDTPHSLHVRNLQDIYPSGACTDFTAVQRHRRERCCRGILYAAMYSSA